MPENSIVVMYQGNVGERDIPLYMIYYIYIATCRNCIFFCEML